MNNDRKIKGWIAFAKFFFFYRFSSKFFFPGREERGKSEGRAREEPEKIERRSREDREKSERRAREGRERRERGERREK
jgi:hypothetical protein